MTIEIAVLCSVGGAVFGFVFSYLTHRRNAHKDTADAAKHDAVVLTEIGYIKSGVDDIKRKQEGQDAKYVEMAERVTKVEASAAQAHRRIDYFGGNNQQQSGTQGAQGMSHR